jgi:hypothetical protein
MLLINNIGENPAFQKKQIQYHYFLSPRTFGHFGCRECSRTVSGLSFGSLANRPFEDMSTEHLNSWLQPTKSEQGTWRGRRRATQQRMYESEKCALYYLARHTVVCSQEYMHAWSGSLHRQACDTPCELQPQIKGQTGTIVHRHATSTSGTGEVGARPHPEVACTQPLVLYFSTMITLTPKSKPGKECSTYSSAVWVEYSCIPEVCKWIISALHSF